MRFSQPFSVLSVASVAYPLALTWHRSRPTRPGRKTALQGPNGFAVEEVSHARSAATAYHGDPARPPQEDRGGGGAGAGLGPGEDLGLPAGRGIGGGGPHRRGTRGDRSRDGCEPAAGAAGAAGGRGSVRDG